MKHPIDELMRDHRLIEQVLDAIEATDSPRPVAFYEKVLDFITHYADERHHEKEEGMLFPALTDHGIPSNRGPIGCMLHEHEDARMHTRRIREAVAEGNTVAAARAGDDYAALLRDHIAKEDNVLYKMALEILPSQIFDQMARDFEAVESRAPCRDRYRALADEITQSAHRLAPARHSGRGHSWIDLRLLPARAQSSRTQRGSSRAIAPGGSWAASTLSTALPDCVRC